MGAAIQTQWTDERVDELKRLFALTDPVLSAAQMGAALGVSRCSVLGKINRLGMKREGAPPRTTLRNMTRRPAPQRTLGSHIAGKVKRKPRSYGHHAPAWKDAIVKDNVRDLPHDKSPWAVSLYDAREHHCRWPLGEPSAMTFCGDHKVHGYSYCARHCRLAYMPRTRPNDTKPVMNSSLIDPRSLDSAA